jgi:hopene-associated glycosyltransferase HpnB
VGLIAVPILAILGLAVWAYLLTCHGGFWRVSTRLPTSRPPLDWPAVTAIIPARHEAAILPRTLPTLIGQDYPGDFRVIVIDDRSTDDTAAVAAGLGATVLSGVAREPGWAGKVHAMAQGLAKADTEWVLFTDADIAWQPGALRELVASAGDRAMVSQMVQLRTQTMAERVLVPAFVYFFAQLYPFRRVSSRRSRTAAAAGGCMLVRRDALVAAGGFEPIKGALIDDVALGALLKRAGNDIWLGLTTRITSERPYPRLADLWQMIARSAYTQLRYNPLLLLGTVLGLAFVYLVPPAALLTGLLGAGAVGAVGAGGVGWLTAGWLTAGWLTAGWLTAAAGGAAWLLMTVSYIPMLRLYRLSPLRAVWLPLIALAYTAMTLDSARRHYTRRPVTWRG